MRDESFWDPLFGDNMPLTEIAHYFDPFYAECRAYGRLKGCIAKGSLQPDLVVPCHGYILLGKRDRKTLESRGVDFDLTNPHYQKTSTEGMRVRGIVKELVNASESGVNQRSLRKILSDIITLNKAGVYNRDIWTCNFREGKFVDFGMSWTEPHEFLDVLGPKGGRIYRRGDRAQFERMIREEGIPNPRNIRGVHEMQLRSRNRTSRISYKM